ncbi:MAG: pyrroline-5-carboxylate reductase [Dehalococcoidia bacterium]|nr:pyrroline-5-carboxylate reductase [Dehalococcoidia bacterium]
MRISFIGGGAMGEAIIRGILAKGVATPQDMVVSDISQTRRELLTNEYGIETLDDNRQAAKGADLIVLAVKPQNLARVVQDLKAPSPEQLVVSILAGGTLAKLCQDFNHLSVVRAAPNMPAQIGQGITVWTATADTNERQKELARTVLGAVGKEIYVTEEKYLDMATALGGSGAAYVFLFIEAFIDAGVHVGLPRDLSQQVVTQTILGSTSSVEMMGKHPAVLKNMVTSPGGTTTEALFQLEKGAFRALLYEAVAAAHSKAQRL